MMDKLDVKGRSIGIMARIQAATARHDPSYKLKKSGFLNAHDMRKLIPSRDSLILGADGLNDPIKISGVAETDIKKLYPRPLFELKPNPDDDKRVRDTLDVLKRGDLT